MYLKNLLSTALLLGLLACVSPLSADDGEIAACLRALRDGLPSVARVKLTRMLKAPGKSEADQAKLRGLLLEACLYSSDTKSALELLNKHKLSDETYWRGLAEVMEGDFDAAATTLASYPDSGRYRGEAKLALAHALVGQGREAAARRTIKDLRESPDQRLSLAARNLFNELELDAGRDQVVLDRLAQEEHGKEPLVQFLKARALLMQGQTTKAETVIREALISAGQTEHGHNACTILLARVLAAKRQTKASTDLLLEFLARFSTLNEPMPDDLDFLTEAFETLEKNCTDPIESQRVLTAAVTWACEAKLSARRGESLYLVAQLLHRSGRDAEAIGFLESLIALYPRHPHVADAMRLAMQIHGSQGADNRVIALAALWQKNYGGGEASVVDFLLGMIRFTRGEYAAAAGLFVKSADADSDLARRRHALYNAALSATKAGKTALVTSLMAQLSQAGDQAALDSAGKGKADGASATDLMLNQALAQAAAGETSLAESALDTFVKQETNAGHPRTAEAYVTLAEIRLLDQPPRVETAESALQAAGKASPPAAIAERIDYLRIWIKEAKEDLNAVAEAGHQFISKWPKSSKAAEVHMKMAEAYYRNQNLASARTYFELVAKNWPESPYAEAALFFAGKAAMAIGNPESVDAAITLWEELAETRSPLGFEARIQQAAAKRLLGNFSEALKLLDALLAEASPDRKPSLLCDKAEILMSLGQKQPSYYKQSSDLLAPASLPPGIPYVWQARIGYLRALALRAQGLTDEVLEVCTDTVEAGVTGSTPAATPSEFEWLYRAGFLAIELLEETKQWEPAAQLADRLATGSAPQAKEAAAKASRIRLQHYLWDGKK